MVFEATDVSCIKTILCSLSLPPELELLECAEILRLSLVSPEVYRERVDVLEYKILCCSLQLCDQKQTFLSSFLFYLQGWLTNDLPFNSIYPLLETCSFVPVTAGFIIPQIKR